jgi:inhibitor of cysteine peptidase
VNKYFIVALMNIFVIILALTGCSIEKMTYSDSSQTINASLGQEFKIALGSNPTTGYSWQPDYDNVVLELINKEYKADDKSGQQIVGSGGTEYFTFKALKNGETKVTLTYRRPWESPKPQDTRQIFNIVVK